MTNTNINATTNNAHIHNAGYSSSRTITQVIDTSLPAGKQLRTTQSVLDPLTVSGLAILRDEVTSSRETATPRFVCIECGEPLSLPKHPASATVPADGRGAYFKHAFIENAPACSLRTKGGVYDVGAVQFAGQQEGIDHHALKLALAACLRSDPRFSDVQIEKRVTGQDGTYRVPDVSALYDGMRITFDLQLATLPISTIQDRNDFYRANGCHHVWLTDAADLSRLSRQAFCDLHLTTGGRIFAIDDASISASISAGQFQLQELQLLPRLASQLAIHNTWDKSLVGIDVILMDHQRRKADGVQIYQQALSNKAEDAFGPELRMLRDAATKNLDLRLVAAEWRRISNSISGMEPAGAKSLQLGAVMAFLSAAERYSNARPENRALIAPKLQRRLTTLLGAQSALHWSPLVVQVHQTFPCVQQALTPENAARLNALLTSPDKVKPYLRYNAGMLSVLFPWLGFRLLAKPPKFAPNLRISGRR